MRRRGWRQREETDSEATRGPRGQQQPAALPDPPLCPRPSTDQTNSGITITKYPSLILRPLSPELQSQLALLRAHRLLKQEASRAAITILLPRPLCPCPSAQPSSHASLSWVLPLLCHFCSGDRLPRDCGCLRKGGCPSPSLGGSLQPNEKGLLSWGLLPHLQGLPLASSRGS